MFLRGFFVPLKAIPESTPFILGMQTGCRHWFFSYSEDVKNPPFSYQAYLLMRFLHQPYEQFMRMPRGLRLELVKIQYDAIKKGESNEHDNG